MGFFTSLAGVAISAGGALMGGIADRNAAKARARMEAYNARVAEMNARAAEEAAKFEQIREAKAGERRRGRLFAQLSASGAMTSEGIPLLLLAEQLMEDEMATSLIGFEGVTAASRHRSDASMSRMRGSAYRAQAGNALLVGGVRAGSSLLHGFANMKQQEYI